MIRLNRLYSEPEVFTPIEFHSGLNIILGERSEESNKTNGVGKSVCVEFINFCLLKKANESRVLRIPDSVLEDDTKIKLDLQINGKNLTITRSKGIPHQVTIQTNGKEIIFEKLDEASEFLGNIYFENYSADITRLSFRVLLSPVLRDERSEFKDIIKTHDTDKLIPRDFRPHLFFLDLDVDLFQNVKTLTDDLAKKKAYVAEIKKQLTNNGQSKVSDAKAHLNDLESKVSKINQSIEKLQNKESFEAIQDDLIELESELRGLRAKQKAIQFEIRQISSLPTPENISETEIAILYNQFKSGLGDMIKVSLEQVKNFKNTIDHFRNTIVNKRVEVIKLELFSLNKKISELDSRYSNKLGLIDQGSIVSDLKTAINVFREKNEELISLQSLVNKFDSEESEKKRLTVQRNGLLVEFDTLIQAQSSKIKNFEKTILDLHEQIFGSRNAHFEIKTLSSLSRKEFLEFDLRTADDHSYSSERLKVFMYDVALMINEHTRKRHPRFLIHDNIFNVDIDSLEKSLNFLYRYHNAHPEEFQYILTLNRDMVEDLESKEKLVFSIDNFRRASFTKENRFLRNAERYTEESPKPSKLKD